MRARLALLRAAKSRSGVDVSCRAIVVPGQGQFAREASFSNNTISFSAWCPLRPYSSSSVKGKEKANDSPPGLRIELGPRNEFTTIQDVLLSRVPEKGASKYLVALAEHGQDGSTSLCSLGQQIPLDCKSLRFLTFQDDEHAKASLWWTSAFVLSATLDRVYNSGNSSEHGIVIASPPRLVESGGFAVQFHTTNRSEDPNTSSSADVSALDESIAKLRAHTGESSEELRSLDLVTLEKAFHTTIQELTARKGVRVEWVDISDARARFASNPFKREELDAHRGEKVQLLTLGTYVDIVPDGVTLSLHIDAIKALKLQEKSLATWKPVQATAAELPSSQSIILVRGISFPSSTGLKQHLTALEEALKHDHRTIGQAQRLFFTHDSSPGTPFMLPHGMRIASKIERVIRDLYRQWDYHEVLTPQVFKADLWKRSGHWDNYRDDMFAVEGFKELQERTRKSAEDEHSSCGDITHAADPQLGVEASAYGLKPMNCPGHCLLYAAQEHSYRDLPIRYAEFSPLHRNEASGALTGLTRVRRFHQDDAHVFCRVDQIFGEIASMLKMLREAYTLFGFSSFELVLSTRPVQYIGEQEDWDRAESALRRALDGSGLSWTLNEGDGAFYGPKIDIRLVDASGKRHQTATIQLDFQLPRRFALHYANPKTSGSDGDMTPPVMIHRAILGSMERFMAILTESTRGFWPFWLSPRQAVVLPVSNQDETLVTYAQQVRDALALGTRQTYTRNSRSNDQGEPDQRQRRPSHTFHVDVDASNDTLAKRVRRAQLDRVNFVCVVGQAELASNTVQVRSRDSHEDIEFDQMDGKQRPRLTRDMGALTTNELRDLFVTLDDHHW